MSPSAASFSRVEGPAAIGGERLLGVAAVELELLLGHRGQERAALGVDRAALDEDLGQGLALGPRPGAEGGDELVLVDQADFAARAGRRAGREASRRVGPWSSIPSVLSRRGGRRIFDIRSNS